MTARGLFLLLALGACGAGPRPGVELRTLADGTEVLLVRLADAPGAALRYVVRAGGADDPPRKQGLAHMVEHLVFEGTYESSGTAIQDLVREAGGEMNALTLHHATIYTLEAPRDAFFQVAAPFLGMVTGPALQYANLSLAQSVIHNEHLARAGVGGLGTLLDQYIFAQPGGGILGTSSTRASITTEDVVGFFRRHYVPRNTTVVVVGDLEIDQVVAMVEGALRLAPALDAPPPHQTDHPLLPVEANAPGLQTFAAYGYRIDPEHTVTCRDLALLLELRLALETQVEDVLASGVAVECLALRGQRFLIAVAYTGSFSGSTLPDVLRTTFQEFGPAATAAREKRMLRTRADNQWRRLSARSTDVANWIMLELAVPRGASTQEVIDALMRPPSFTGAAIKRVVDDSFHSDRRMQIRFTQFRD